MQDLSGLSLKQLSPTFFSVFTRISKMYQDNYPVSRFPYGYGGHFRHAPPAMCLQETMSAMFLVNIPGFFHMVWRMLSPAIDERVKQKIFFLRSRDLDILKDFIPGSLVLHPPSCPPSPSARSGDHHNLPSPHPRPLGCRTAAGLVHVPLWLRSGTTRL